MIDFLKFTFRPENFADWLQCVNIDFKHVKSKTYKDRFGNLLTAHTYEGWKCGFKLERKQTLKPGYGMITIEDNQIMVSGSIHKSNKRSNQYPDGENFSRFVFSELLNQLHLLSRDLFFDLDQARLLNIEYGFNLPLPECPTSFIRGNLFFFHAKTFKEFESGSITSIGSRINFQEYSIKVYDKGLQYGLNYHLLRIEIKFKKLRELKCIDICYLSDLTKQDKLKLLHGVFMKKWNKVVLYDDRLRGLNNKQRDFYIKCGQKGFLEMLKLTNDKKLYYYIAKFKYINNKFGNVRMNTIKNLLTSEFDICGSR